jgi:hypothetical protein
MVNRAKQRQCRIDFALSVPQKQRHANGLLGVLRRILGFAQLGNQQRKQIVEDRLCTLTDQRL